MKKNTYCPNCLGTSTKFQHILVIGGKEGAEYRHCNRCQTVFNIDKGFPKHLVELLVHYDEFMKDFLKKCRDRIIVGAKQYGGDWKTKDNLKERDDEIYDLLNYTALDYAQSKWKNRKK